MSNIEEAWQRRLHETKRDMEVKIYFQSVSSRRELYPLTMVFVYFFKLKVYNIMYRRVVLSGLL